MAAIIAFTSGKGGVGKTNISTNLGLSLVARHSKVCLFDADTGLANINILMGITPNYTIEHVLNGQKSIEEIIVTLPSGISIVPAASGIQQCTNLDDERIAKLTSSLEMLEKNYDYLFIDTAAGIDNNVLDFVESAQYKVVVITPEPTSLTDSFALLKMLLARGQKKPIFILVNRVESHQVSQIVFKRFQQAVKKYLAVDVHYLGFLPTDESVNKAVTQQLPVVISYPHSPVSRGFATLADVVKKHFINENNIPFFSHYWTQIAQQNKAEIKEAPVVNANVENTSVESSDVENTNKDSLPTKQPTDNTLSDVYTLLDQQQLSDQQLKEFILTLETIYEKKHKQSFRDLNSLVALILAKADEEKIKKFYNAIAHSFERQFKSKINNPVENFKNLITDEHFPKKDFTCLMDNFSTIYQQRFNEKYFTESIALLTQIQQLLSDND
jgi:flagellar biosynthesis protein FlhG